MVTKIPVHPKPYAPVIFIAGRIYLNQEAQSSRIFLYNKAKDQITKRLWVLPSDMVMAELAGTNVIVHKRYENTGIGVSLPSKAHSGNSYDTCMTSTCRLNTNILCYITTTDQGGL